MEKIDFTKVAEVKLSYATKIKASDRPQVTCSKDAYEVFMKHWDGTIEFLESVYVLLLNRANRVLGITSISNGSTAGCIIDVKMILQYALKTNACSMIIAHNHPSGNLQPSESDINITKKLSEAAKLLDISLLDHLIITPHDGYYSMVD